MLAAVFSPFHLLRAAAARRMTMRRKNAHFVIFCFICAWLFAVSQNFSFVPHIATKVHSNSSAVTLAAPPPHNATKVHSNSSAVTLAAPPLSGIPRIIWQTFKSSDPPPWIVEKRETWVHFAPSFDVRVHTDEEVDSLLRMNFPTRMYSMFKRMPLPVMKADLWRYAVIYLYGGVYADSDTTANTQVSRWLDPDCDVVIGLENWEHICNWVFAATARHPLFEYVLNFIAKRFEDDFHESTFRERHDFVHYFTGPGVFTDAFVSFATKDGSPRPDVMYNCDYAVSKTDHRQRCQFHDTYKRLPVVTTNRICLRNSTFFWNDYVTNHFMSLTDGQQSWISQRDALLRSASTPPP